MWKRPADRSVAGGNTGAFSLRLRRSISWLLQRRAALDMQQERKARAYSLDCAASPGHGRFLPGRVQLLE